MTTASHLAVELARLVDDLEARAGGLGLLGEGIRAICVELRAVGEEYEAALALGTELLEQANAVRGMA